MNKCITRCIHDTVRQFCEPCDLADQLEEAQEQIRVLQKTIFNLRTWAQSNIKEEDTLNRLRDIIKI